jgi:hypothetical protein
MTIKDPKPRFTKKIANQIANTSVCYVLESIRSKGVDDRLYDLEESSDRFIDNFVEDLESRGFFVSEGRVDVIKECFDSQLEKVRNQVESIYQKLSVKYNH